MLALGGKNVVVTGKIDGFSRQSAEAQLRDRGARIQSSVTGDTDLLVTGHAVGQTKLNAARKHGAEILAWDQLMNGAPRAATPSFARSKARTVRVLPKQVAPMLAQPGSETLPGDGWLYEVKYDGYRAIAFVKGGEVFLQSRSGKPLEFPLIAEELAGLPDCILDGEIVVPDGKGGQSFHSLASGHPSAVYVVFDVVEVDGIDVRHEKLEHRQALIVGLLDSVKATRIQRSPVFEDGEALLEVARNQQLEGIVAKRKGSRYEDGSRSPSWLKIKLRCEQEFVVCGWTPGKNGNTGRLGALVLGINDDDGLVYAGRVGTGFTDAEGDRLQAALETIGRDDCPFGERPKVESKETIWVEPVMVVQVEFQHWTEDGRLWHPAYKGVRTDKQAAEVRREPSAGAGKEAS